jgi:hypothetical protein
MTAGQPPKVPGEVESVEGELDAALVHAEKASKLTPKALHLHEHERFVSSLEQDRTRLRERAEGLAAELDELRPAHAALAQQVASLTVCAVLGTVLLAVGAALVSTALNGTDAWL